MKHIYSMLALLGIAGTAGAQAPVETQLKAADIVPGKTIVLKSVSELRNHYFMTTGNFTKLYSPKTCNFTVEAATYNEDNSGKYFRLKVGDNYLKANDGNTQTTTDSKEAAIFYAQAITQSGGTIDGITIGDCLPNTDLAYLVRFVRADKDAYLNCGDQHMKYANGKGGFSAFYVYDSTDTDAIIGAHACYLPSGEATNTAMLPATVSEGEETSATAPFYLIQNNSQTDFYCGNITNAVALDNAEGYVFVSVTDKPHAYKIYSLAAGKFLTWTGKTAAKDQILTDGSGQNDLWWVRPDNGWNANTTAVDILPYGEFTLSWNWHGGASNNSDHRMGLFQYDDGDGNSQWKLTNVRTPSRTSPPIPQARDWENIITKWQREPRIWTMHWPHFTTAGQTIPPCCLQQGHSCPRQAN